MKDNLLSNGYSLADKVFKKLEEEILNGALKAGENLTELRISAVWASAERQFGKRFTAWSRRGWYS